MKEDEEHVLGLLQSLPARRSHIIDVVEVDDRRRSRSRRGSTWRAISPYGYGSQIDEPEWIQQDYESHREWYDDLDTKSKEVYLRYLYDLLKQARKKSLDDLEERCFRRRRLSKWNLYAIVEQLALNEKWLEKRRPTRRYVKGQLALNMGTLIGNRPVTPTFQPVDQRITSWVSTQHLHPVQNLHPEVDFYPTATEHATRGLGGNVRGRRPIMEEEEAEWYQPAVLTTGNERFVELSESAEESLEDRRKIRRPRSRSSSTRRPRSKSSSVRR
jgi:hypothetical protein